MVLCNLNKKSKEERSATFMPLIQGKDVADMDVEGPVTAEDA
jgi:hypothetical protein